MSDIDHLDKGKNIMSKQQASNWELHDGAEDGYLDVEKDSPLDPEDNLPLARTVTANPNQEGIRQAPASLPKRKAVIGGNLYSRVTNRKNMDPYFNLVKKDIIDSSEHTTTLDNGHVLCKSNLATKGRILPCPNKIIVTQTPSGHKLHAHSSLAGKRTLSPPKKPVNAPSRQSGQGTSGADRNMSLTGAPTAVEATQDFTKFIKPKFHQSQSNQGLSVTGTADSPHWSSQLTVHTDLREIIDIPDSAGVEGSQESPILIDSIPETTANPTTQQPPRRNVGSPQFYGNRRFTDVVLEKDDTGTSLSSYTTSPGKSRATFTISSPSDFLTPLAEAPPRQTLIAETILTWSTKNSYPMFRPVNSPITTLLNENSSGSHSTHQTITIHCSS